MERNGPVDTPEFYAEILQDFMDEVVEEAEQTTLPVEEEKGLKTGSKEAKDAAEKANKNMPVSNEVSVAVMAKVVGNVVVGTTRTWYGRKTDKTAHRFEIPPGAELRGKTWYFPDPVSGKWLPLSIED